MKITEPLRLATGSHQAGSGRGCAMNVISWENGDTTITDLPACSDPFLARIVQRVNDSICRHTLDGMLCPSCSVEVLDLGHRTVGTGSGLDLSPDERRRVWVRIAVTEARRVERRQGDVACNDATEGWLDGTHTAYATADAAAAAFAATVAAAADAAAADAEAYATAAATVAAAAHASFAASVAATVAATVAAAAHASFAAYAAAYADADAALRVEQAHRIIDQFQTLTGHTDTQPDTTIVAEAVARMLATT
jgi:hypothetical protein